MSQWGCLGSGNKWQRQKKGPWSLGERKAKVRHLGGRSEERERRLQEGEPTTRSILDIWIINAIHVGPINNKYLSHALWERRWCWKWATTCLSKARWVSHRSGQCGLPAQHTILLPLILPVKSKCCSHKCMSKRLFTNELSLLPPDEPNADAKYQSISTNYRKLRNFNFITNQTTQ